MTLSFVPSHGEAVLAYEKAMRERNRLLKEGVRDPAWYGALETAMADAGAAITKNRRLALDRLARAQEEGAESAFPTAALRLVAPEGEVAEAADDLAVAFATGRGRDMAAGRTLSGPHRADLGADFAAKGVPAAQCSTGEQKALLIALILANARALAEDLGARKSCCWTRWPRILTPAAARRTSPGEICALGAQALMTGTGRELFESLERRAQGLEVTETAGLSRIEERSLQ